jgi:hypothetical protein
MSVMPLNANQTIRGELISISDAVKKYRIKKDAWYQLIRIGEIKPYYPPFTLVRLDTADINDLLQKSKDPAYKDAVRFKEAPMRK